MMCVMGVLTFASCGDDDSEGLTDIISYPELHITGDEFYINPIGETYVDQGCTATYNGEDYTSHIVTTGLDEIDVNVPGLYTVTYTATSPAYDKHPQGYTIYRERTVAVCDPSIITRLDGSWTTQSGTNLVTARGSELDYSKTTATISYLCPGIFQIDDYLANEMETQEYTDYAGQGYDFQSGGIFQLTADNKIVMVSSDAIEAFSSAPQVTEINNGTYDPETGTITYDAVVENAGSYWRTYHIILKK